MAYTERQISFENEGQTLYGFLHVPEGAGPHPAVALLHGFGGNHMEPRAIFTRTARRLASSGITALRFDFRGSGDSEGAFRDASIESEVSDARTGLRFLGEQPEVDAERLGLVGLSLGGMIAARTAGEGRHVRALVLWSPVAHLGELFATEATEERARELLSEGYVDFGGLEVGMDLVRQATETDPVAALDGYADPVLVIHGTADELVPAEHGQRYKAALGDRADLELVEGADHVYSAVPWERQVMERTTAWLTEHL